MFCYALLVVPVTAEGETSGTEGRGGDTNEGMTDGGGGTGDNQLGDGGGVSSAIFPRRSHCRGGDL